MGWANYPLVNLYNGARPARLAVPQRRFPGSDEAEVSSRRGSQRKMETNFSEKGCTAKTAQPFFFSAMLSLA